MSKCFRIRLKETPTNIHPSLIDSSDGYVYFDADTTQIMTQKAIGELNDLGKFKTEEFLFNNLSYSAKNNKILSAYGNPHLVGFDYKATIPIQITNGFKTFDEYELQIDCPDDKNKRFVTKIVRGQNEIFKCLSETYFCNLDLGEFVLNLNNLNLNWGDETYQDGDLGFYYGGIDYGRRYGGGQFVVEDFRGVPSELFLMQRAACSCGYTFRSPIYETGWGRREYAYILDQNYGSSPAALAARKFTASGGSLNQLNDGDNLVYPNENDPGANYDNTTGEVQGIQTSKFEWSHSFIVVSGMGEISVRIVRKDLNGIETLLYQDAQQVPNGFSGLVNFSTTLENVTLGPTDTLCIIYTEAGTLIINHGYGELENFPIKTTYTDGDTIPLNETIDCDATAIMILAGMAHKVKGQIIVDPVTREIWLYNRDFVTLPDGSQPEPFFSTQAEDITDRVLCMSKKAFPKEVGKGERYYNLCYKTSTDEQVKEDIKNGILEKNELHAREVDFNYTDNSKTKQDCNPTYEPTPTGKVLGLDNSSVQAVFAAQMRDNLDGEMTFNVGYRTLHAYGNFEQDPGNGIAYRWKLEGVEKTHFPLLAQRPPEGVNVGPFTDESNVYGLRENDLGMLFWETYLSELKYGLPIDFDIFYNDKNYCAENFRTLKAFDYQGKPFLAKLLQMKSKFLCSNLPVTGRVLHLPNDRLCLTAEGEQSTGDCQLAAVINVITGEVCTYTLSTDNLVVTLIDDSYFINVTFDRILTEQCGADPPTQTVANIAGVIEVFYWRTTRTQIGNPLQDGVGYLGSINVLTDNPFSLIGIDFNPCSVLTTYPGLTGTFTPSAGPGTCPGCATCVQELIFDAGNPAQLENAIITVIDHAIGLFNAATEYQLDVNVTANGDVTIGFRVKHNPAGPYANQAATFFYFPDGATLVNNGSVQIDSTFNLQISMVSPCGVVTVNTLYQNYFLGPAYNQYAEGGFPTLIDQSNGANILACSDDQLEVVVSNCTGTWTVLWDNGETTPIIDDPGTRPFNAVVTCDDGCVITATIQ